MLPDIAAFEVMESPATVVVGATTYANCGVIYSPPPIGAAELSAGVPFGVTVDNRGRIDVRKDQVPALPIGATIIGSMDGMLLRTYRVNRVESRDPQYHHAWVD